MQMSTVWTLARKELNDALRNRWFVLYTVAFAVLALGLRRLWSHRGIAHQPGVAHRPAHGADGGGAKPGR
jgi:Cu-processing system permease protein